MKQLEFEMDSKEAALPDNIEYKWSIKTRIFIGLLIFFIILFIVILLILLIGAKKVSDDNDDYKKEKNIVKNEKDDLENEVNDLKIYLNNQMENNSMMFIYYNVTYADKNNQIKNTFKKGGEHYIEELGEINNGSDYNYTYNNQYDLYIPYIATQSKKKYNRVILYIHGGAWYGQDKRDEAEFCKTLTKLGFITASLEYTFLNIEKFKNVNIYRLVDEIITAVKHLKNFLKNEGFDENKLELCLIGGSAGAHLSLLYSYLVKNSTIPVKLILLVQLL